jgi:3D (Asp-Asp-Asp) domain-containing protein
MFVSLIITGAYRIKNLEATIWDLENRYVDAATTADLYKRCLEHDLEATAYSLREEECNDDLNNTATMTKPVPGWTVAVSRDLAWMMGKRVYIAGLGVRKVNDLMNARYENAIDILVPDKDMAMEFGRKTLKVVVIE